MPINHKIFLAQFDTIKQLAEQESCVIVGRCADYALSDYPKVVSVFITASDEDRIASLKKLYNVDDAKACLLYTSSLPPALPFPVRL